MGIEIFNLQELFSRIGIIEQTSGGISCASIVISPQTITMKLFVAGLPNDFDDTDLKEMFELYGEVISAKIVMDRETGKTKGFGFVDMKNKAEALETIEALDGAGLPRGKKIVVKEAEEQPPRNNNFNRSNNRGFNNNRY